MQTRVRAGLRSGASGEQANRAGAQRQCAGGVRGSRASARRRWRSWRRADSDLGAGPRAPLRSSQRHPLTREESARNDVADDLGPQIVAVPERVPLATLEEAKRARLDADVQQRRRMLSRVGGATLGVVVTVDDDGVWAKPLEQAGDVAATLGERAYLGEF